MGEDYSQGTSRAVQRGDRPSQEKRVHYMEEFLWHLFKHFRTIRWRRLSDEVV